MPLSEGDGVSLAVTPDRYVTVRYAGASGDFNPIHVDEEFARQVGLPGRILHGLWSMAQVARAVTEAAGGPVAGAADPGAGTAACAEAPRYTLESLSVQFRGMGRIGEEIVVSGTAGPVEDGLTPVALEARQGDTRLIRNARAHVRATI